MTLRSYRIGALLAPIILVAATIGSATAQTLAGLTSKVSAAPAHIKHGGTATLAVSVTDKTADVPNAVVDMEIYNAQGKKVAQHAWQGQRLSKGQTSAYHWVWNPTAVGTYTVKLGVFGANWKRLLHWSDKALILPVT